MERRIVRISERAYSTTISSVSASRIMPPGISPPSVYT
jgi:hypothetical protein